MRFGFVTAWRFAACPTSRSPLSVNATTEGVSPLALRVRDDARLAALHDATTEFVVPRSMPMTFCEVLPCGRRAHIGATRAATP